MVDDNSSIGTLLKVALERHDYRVLTFGDPHAALNYLGANTASIAFAIVDINLGGDMDGLAFARELRGLQPNTIVIFSTGRNLSPEQKQFSDEHDALFLPKPFHLNQLGGLVAEVEQRRKGPGQH